MPPLHQHLLPEIPQPNALVMASPAARDAALPTAPFSPTKACQIRSGTAPQRSPRTTAGISVLAKSWHIPQPFHGHPNMGGMSPSEGALSTKPNHGLPRATQRAKPCSSVRPASPTAAVPRALTCLWFPSSPPGSASCRPDPMQDGAVRLKGHLSFVQISQGQLVGTAGRTQGWMDPGGSGTADPAQELLPEGVW